MPRHTLGWINVIGLHPAERCIGGEEVAETAYAHLGNLVQRQGFLGKIFPR